MLSALQKNGDGGAQQDSQTLLQANKATFFFRLERELEKVNIFYLQKEAEVGLASIEQKPSKPSAYILIAQTSIEDAAGQEEGSPIARNNGFEALFKLRDPR